MKKYCNNCGFENADKDTFCMNCGAKLSDPKIESREPVAPAPSEINGPIVRPSEKRFAKPGKIVLTSNKNISGLAIIAIILSIVAIIFAAFVSPAITLGSGSVDTQKLADNSVTGDKIVDGTITNSDISSNGIAKIADNSIGSSQIIDGSILMDDLASATISALTGLNVIANDSINGSKIADFSIASNDLANNSVTSLKIVDGTITAADIGADAVGSSEITDNSVSYSDMAIKIKCGIATNVVNGSTITHSLGHIPTSVVVTPVYEPGVEDGKYVIHANIENNSLGSNSFDICLWYEVLGTPPATLGVIDGVAWPSVNVYWIAIYSP